MDDLKIVELYWQRDEQALQKTEEKYHAYCHSIAFSILQNREDSEECVNDTWLAAWQSIPPHRPRMLRTYLGKITRRLSLKRYRSLTADKRGGGEVVLALEELAECIPDVHTPADELENDRLGKVINDFLDTLPDTEMRVFVCRYWHLDPIDTIARRFGFSTSKVTSMLYRTRQKLSILLRKENIEV